MPLEPGITGCRPSVADLSGPANALLRPDQADGPQAINGTRNRVFILHMALPEEILSHYYLPEGIFKETKNPLFQRRQLRLSAFWIPSTLCSFHASPR